MNIMFKRAVVKNSGSRTNFIEMIILLKFGKKYKHFGGLLSSYYQNNVCPSHGEKFKPMEPIVRYVLHPRNLFACREIQSADSTYMYIVKKALFDCFENIARVKNENQF